MGEHFWSLIERIEFEQVAMIKFIVSCSTEKGVLSWLCHSLNSHDGSYLLDVVSERSCAALRLKYLADIRSLSYS